MFNNKTSQHKFSKFSRQTQSNNILLKAPIRSESPTNESLNFDHFTEHSSIHGLRFLSKRRNNNFTRIFWSLSLVMSLIGLLYNGKRLYVKLNVSPDIGISVKHEQAREVPFPAVTFCMPLFAKNGIANYSNYIYEYYKNGKKNLLNLTETDKQYLSSNSLRCAINRLQPFEECCSEINISNILQLMDDSQLMVEESLAGCSFRHINIDCKDMFRRILTDRGFCFTTNMQSIDTIINFKEMSKDLQKYYEYPRSNKTTNNESKIHWRLDHGYADSLTKGIIPYRLTKANVHIARTFSTVEDAINVCNLRTILVKIHMPNEIPTIFHGGFQVEQTHEKRLKLRAKATKADSSLRVYSPSTRLCYFDDEKKLRYFKTYTKHQCYLECLAEDVIGKCGCVAFYMPRNSSTRVCGFKEAMCVHRSTYDWPDDEDLESGTSPCNCYPTCNDIEYTISETDFVYDASIHADRIQNYSQDLLYSRVYVHFDDHVIQLNEKFVSYKFQNFIADLGGLLGLFLGCSLLSMIEVLYFICMALKEKYFKINFSAKKKSVSNHQDFLKTMDKINNDIYVVRAPLYKRGNK